MEHRLLLPFLLFFVYLWIPKPLVAADGLRRQLLSGDAVEFKLISGSYKGLGYYMAEVELSNKTLRLVIGTGSDLTWVKPDSIISNRVVYCQQCPTPDHCELQTNCSFTYPYARSSVSYNFCRSNMTMRFMNSSEVPKDISLGCSYEVEGGDFKEVDGVFGLGNEITNVESHILNGTSFGQKFSYCLVDHLSPQNVTGFLAFGEIDKSMSSNLTRIPYKTDEPSTFYKVNIDSIMVKETRIKVNKTRPNLFGSTAIIDSGRNLTILPEEVVNATWTAYSQAFHNATVVNDDDGVFAHCFRDDTVDWSHVNALTLTIVFGNGAAYTPNITSVWTSVASNVTCLGIVSNKGGHNVIGNIMQQNYYWEFDVTNKTIGFAPAPTCALT